MRITQRELRKIIREELSRTARGLQEGGAFSDNPSEEELHHSAVTSRDRQIKNELLDMLDPDAEDDIVALHIVPGKRTLWGTVFSARGAAAVARLPQFFTSALIDHEPTLPGGELEVYKNLIKWARRYRITHVVTDFFHEMGLAVPDQSIISLPEFAAAIEDSLAAAGVWDSRFASPHTTLEDM